MVPFSFVIFKDGTNFQAKNTTTDAIEFTNPSAAFVFNSVIKVMSAAGGGIACIRNAVYPLHAAIFPMNFTGFVGESSNKTILRSKIPVGGDTLFRYWEGASSVPLEGFSLSNIKIEINNAYGNGTGGSEMAWISSGMKDCTFDSIYVRSYERPHISSIGFFMDTAQNTNNNENLVLRNSRFEGSCNEQDFLGCGNLINCDFSHNIFIDTTAQAIGVGASLNSMISNNRFIRTGNAIGYESLCENNIISGNILSHSSGIKLSGGWGKNSIHISRNNKCINNTFQYGDGGIEAAISIDDEISGNKFFRTSRNGIQGSFLRTVIDNNIFTDTNWSNSTDRLSGNNTLARTGGIIAYNSNTNMIPKNEWNSFVNNTFYNSGTKFHVNDVQEQGYTNGIVIDTNYLNSFIYHNKGNIGVHLVRNFGTKSNIS